MINENVKKIREYLGLPIRESYKSNYMDMGNVYKALWIGTEPLNVRQLEICA